jgi:predicted AAA+ superfamily ATPase
MDFMKEAISQNEHWETEKIAMPRTGGDLIERDIFPDLANSSRDKFIVIVTGMRRVGKSVLTRQLLQKMMDAGSKPQQLCWFEFDRAMGATTDDLDSLIRFFQGRGAKLIVFDELTFVNGWQDVIKRYYDRSDIKFVITGSSALELDKRSAESLAGRFNLIKINPFSFREWLRMKKYPVPKTELELVRYGEEARMRCDEYVHGSGLPETLQMNERERVEYIRNSFLAPLFFKDIPAVFPSANPDLLPRILELLSASAGSTFQFQTIAQVLGCTHPTIASQIEILRRVWLVRPLFNYSGSLVKQKRTAKKITIADNAILTALNPEVSLGALVENLVAEKTKAGYFWRDSEGREVDIIIPGKKLAIEVKYQNNITTTDEKNLRYFLERKNGWKGLLITKNQSDDGDIQHVPLWRWLL